MSIRQKIFFILIFFGLFLSACTKQETPEISQQTQEKTARSFAEALVGRDYAKAYSLTSKAYQSKNSLNKMKAAFEQIVPLSSGNLKIAQDIMLDSPDPENKNELGTAYITIDFNEDFEAIYLIMVAENNQAAIDTVEFGRVD